MKCTGMDMWGYRCVCVWVHAYGVQGLCAGICVQGCEGVSLRSPMGYSGEFSHQALLAASAQIA